MKNKEINWYQWLSEHYFVKNIIKENISPSQTPHFSSWKQYNPQRDNYF